MLPWSPALGVGIPSIDRQHQRLVALLNELHEAVETGHDADLLLDVFDELHEYTTVHFAYEEALLEEHGYSDLQSHAAQHHALLERFVQLRERYTSGGGPVGADLLVLLREWVSKHLSAEDQLYAAHLRAHGAR